MNASRYAVRLLLTTALLPLLSCGSGHSGENYVLAAERAELDTAIQKKPSGILISVADPNAVKDDIDRAIAAGIPVITVDSDAPTSKRLFFIGTNNFQAGVAGGKRLAKELNGKGNVA